MSSSQKDATFKTSYESFENYPLNLIFKPLYQGALKGYATRLKDDEERLFTKVAKKILVPFLDIFAGKEAFSVVEAHNDEELRKALGETSSPNTSSATSSSTEIKLEEDPTCRFIFLFGEHSRSPLRLTRSMLLRLLTYHQVMPAFLDFLAVFGVQSDARYLRFSGFRYQTMISEQLLWEKAISRDSRSNNASQGTNLGRSGRYFQLCYNLKGASCISNPSTPFEKMQWTIRQAAFHHQFDVDSGKAVWITVKGNTDFWTRIKEAVSDAGRVASGASFQTRVESFRSSLSVHLITCNWSTEGWRSYIEWLEKRVEKESSRALHGEVNPEIEAGVPLRFTTADLQQMHIFEEQAGQISLVLETNDSVLKALQSYYDAIDIEQLIPTTDAQNQKIPESQRQELKARCRAGIADFSMQVTEIIQDFYMHSTRVKLLLSIIANRKNLILQHFQAQSGREMEEIARSTALVTQAAQRDSHVASIIAIGTFIYLPATFVSTFFSTDVIKYQDTDSPSGSFSSVALERWLQVTLPLTALTLGLGLWAIERNSRISETASKPKDDKTAGLDGAIELKKFSSFNDPNRGGV